MNFFSFTSIFLALLGGFASIILYDQSRSVPEQWQAPVFSEVDLLHSLWHSYKERYLEEDTFRALDRSQNFITTSEGQSYTMLRAVFMDDKQTFDGAWKWTKDILKKDDRWLFAWKFGERKDGTYGVLYEDGGDNTATDADIDIATALLLAHARWQDDSYYEAALNILNDIWNYEVITINGKSYILANDLEKGLSKDTYNYNPSYFSPAALRLFAAVDSEHNWLALVESGYELLHQSTTADFGDGAGVLPPDWLALEASTGALLPPEKESSYTTKYGYEALRIPWRIALDWQWHQAPEALAYLQSLEFLSNAWHHDGELHAVYHHDGTPAVGYNSPALYGGALGYFSTIESDVADRIIIKELLSAYDKGFSLWHEDPGYYSSNWIWFGLALHYNQLPNYTALP